MILKCVAVLNFSPDIISNLFNNLGAQLSKYGHDCIKEVLTVLVETKPDESGEINYPPESKL